MTATDTDDQVDGFEWRDGLHQVTIGPAGGNGPVDVGEGPYCQAHPTWGVFVEPAGATSGLGVR